MHLLSASQIQLFKECQRKWGYKYLAKLVVPTHPSAALGTEVHNHQLGPYLIEGKTFDFTRPSGEIAAAMMPLLPAPKTAGLVVERKFEIPSPTGKFGYLGFIDVYAPDSACVPGLAGGRPLLGDFKTTSNLQYAQTPETLATNIQAQLYAMALMYEDGVNELDLVWFYGRTRKPHRTQRVHLRVQAPHVAEQFRSIDAIGAEIVAIKDANPAVDDLPPNARMCDSYGGCPYRHVCNLAPPVHAEGVNQEAMEAKSTDFLAALRKSVPALPAPPAPVPAPVAPAPSAELPAWATAPVDPLRAKPAINPPESALPPAPPAGVPVPAPVEEEKPKRTRRTKAEMEAARASGDASGEWPTAKEIAFQVVEELFARLSGAR